MVTYRPRIFHGLNLSVDRSFYEANSFHLIQKLTLHNPILSSASVTSLKLSPFRLVGEVLYSMSTPKGLDIHLPFPHLFCHKMLCAAERGIAASIYETDQVLQMLSAKAMERWR